MARAESTEDGAQVEANGMAEPAAASPRPMLRKRELVERVVSETGLKRRQARAATESLLAAMGEAVGRGEGLSLEPFGRLRVARTNEGESTNTHTCKLRRKHG